MLLGLYRSLLRKIAAMPKGLARAILLGVMLFVVVRGLAEAEPFDLLLPLWMIALLACVTEDADGASQTSPAASLASIRLGSAHLSGSSAI